MIDLSFGSYSSLENIYQKKYPLPKPELQNYGYLKYFSELPENIQNFMNKLIEEVTTYPIDNSQFILNPSALSMMFYILMALPLKKKKIYIHKPTYVRLNNFCNFLNQAYPDQFILVDNPKEANVEYIIFPNNPDGKLNETKTVDNKKTFIIIDLVYLYPHFFLTKKNYQKAMTCIQNQIRKINSKNKDFILIKNLTQMSSVAGYRISWAYVSNKALIDRLQESVKISHGFSSITVNQFHQQVSDIRWNALFESFSKITKKRTKVFESLFEKISQKSKIKVISLVPFICLYDPGLILFNYFISNEILVLLGSQMGIENEYIRIPVFMKNTEYQAVVNCLKSFLDN